MNLLQPRQNRREQCPQPAFTQRLLGFVQRVQGLPLQVIHHHAGGTVGPEEVANPNDARMIETRERLRLLEELAEPPFVLVRVSVGLRIDASVGFSYREGGRHVLLDGHGDAQVRVPSQIRDAESAPAEHLEELELPQPRARRQCVSMNDRIAHRPITVRPSSGQDRFCAQAVPPRWMDPIGRSDSEAR